MTVIVGGDIYSLLREDRDVAFIAAQSTVMEAATFVSLRLGCNRCRRHEIALVLISPSSALLVLEKCF